MSYVARFDVVLDGYCEENEVGITSFSGFVNCDGMIDAVEKIEERYGAVKSCSIRLHEDFFVEMSKEQVDEMEFCI